MEAAMSTKHNPKLSSMFDILFHFVAFPYMHHSQSYGKSMIMTQLYRWSFESIRKAPRVIKCYPCSCRTLYDRSLAIIFNAISSQQEQLTFGSLTDKIFLFLATFREFPAIFRHFDAFIFIKTS